MHDLQLPIEIRPAKAVATRRLREAVQAHLRAAASLTAIELAGRAYGRAPARKYVRDLPKVSAAEYSAIRRTLARMKQRGEIVVTRRCKRKAMYQLASEARLLATINLNLTEVLHSGC